MDCLFWNIRGIGKGEKILTIRKLVEKKKITFMGLVETKHRNSLRHRLKRIWGNDEYDLCEVFASDTYSGGVIAVWDKKTFTVSNKHTGNRWILLEGCIDNYNFECCVGVMYGHNHREGRYGLLEEVKRLVVNINKPILFSGRFQCHTTRRGKNRNL